MNHVDWSPLVYHLLQSTAFAAAAWMLARALKRNRATVRYSLWLAASIKFLIPFALLVTIGGMFAKPHAAVTERTLPHSAAAAPVDRLPGLPPMFVASPKPKNASLLFPLLLALWFAGFTREMMLWWTGWRRMRTAKRQALGLPGSASAPIPVLLSRDCVEPGVFGVFRPVLLLPAGVVDRLTPAQLDAIIAHELCHVRRRDNLAATVHMVVEAVFWFYPVVRWIGERMVEEREHACDEEVLRTIADPEEYAEGILNVCKFYVGAPLICMSGVTGADLKRRIEAIMTRRVSMHLTRGKKLLLAASGLAAILLPVWSGVMNPPPARAQSQPEKHFAFGAASIKMNPSQDWRQMHFQVDPGHVSIHDAPLILIIAQAYHVPFQSPRLTGAPDWVRGTAYDIEAVPEPGALPPDLPRQEQGQRVEAMMRTLLAERFHLVIRREQKEMPVYAITVAKGGPKIELAKTQEKDCTDNPAPDAVHCHQISGGQGRGIHGEAVTIADAAHFVENWSDRPVIDKTGLPGLFKIDSEGWVPLLGRPPLDPNANPAQRAEAEAMADPARPTLYMIFERLGLKFEPQKGPADIYVIDHVEKPTEN